MILSGTGWIQNHTLLDIDIDPANQVDKRYKGPKIHLHIIMKRDTQKLGNGLQRQLRSATRDFVGFPNRPSCIDAAIPISRNIDPQITRNGKHPCCLGQGINRQNNNRISTKLTIWSAEILAA